MGGAEQTLTSYHPDVRAERSGDIVTVTIDRPKAKNACTGDMWVAIGAAFRDVAYSGTRVVVLTGAGGDFCAGADLGGGGGGGDGRGGQARGNHLDAMRVLGDVVLAVHDCPVPVVAKVVSILSPNVLRLIYNGDFKVLSVRPK